MSSLCRSGRTDPAPSGRSHRQPVRSGAPLPLPRRLRMGRQSGPCPSATGGLLRLL